MEQLKKARSWKSWVEPREGDENYDPGEERIQEREHQRRRQAQLDQEQEQECSNPEPQAQEGRQSLQGDPASHNYHQSHHDPQRNGKNHTIPLESDQPDGRKQERNQSRQSSDTLAPEDNALSTKADEDTAGMGAYEAEYERSKWQHETGQEPDPDAFPSINESRSGVTRQRTSESMRERKKKRHRFGLEPNVRPKQHHDGSQKLLWSRIRATLQEPFSEFLGVLVFTMIQQGGVAQATLSVGETTAPGGNGFGPYLTVPFTTGIGVLLGVYIAGDSGSYLNPAITVANCLFRGLPWRVLPIITLGQILGAFIGTGISFAIYLPAINAYTPNSALFVPPTPGATANLFTSFPQTFSSTTSQVFSVVQRTAIMQCVISALKDDYNLGQQVSSGGSTNFPLNLFFLFFALTSALGWQTAGQTNPALDFGARIMLSAVGYPNSIWTSNSGYAWIPIIVPVIGACLGAWLYDVLVFTGSSPVNSPYLGFKKFWSPVTDLQNRRQRYKQRRDPETGQT